MRTCTPSTNIRRTILQFWPDAASTVATLNVLCRTGSLSPLVGRGNGRGQNVIPLPKRGVRRKSPALPRRLEVTEHAGAQLGLLLGCPGAKAFASFHSELALGDELFQV